MRRFVFTALAVAVAGCGGAQDQAETATQAAETTAPALTAADLAGTWNMETMTETSDSVIARGVLNFGADTNSWTMTLEGRPPVPVQVIAIAGDSVVTRTGPFESVLRPGVMVTTDAVYRLQNGMLMGRTVAHYSVTTPDSVLVLRSHAMRAQ